ncbi:SigB/SigF/SigG family RNA polymerase sigma factor [Dactylosporangium aurantiacum]|uniref:SigB/SigF/SigG family RNA polymerase sigma factor n=1 Tax=Dactylosporangium aurantiacum TaxID=35754 RepID=A0A9Q9MH32_9ACTN|nr:SigB/SigF/SigG family RNA polymerase sigma factor [Dactylosporangium aurantiacum]MDG6103808.1 SigB/SigF/SigG family RNA polymerase sigma factor [Dactylosporangium aurantiacum]UWZ58988.1 SigB/SigF/SigG family RNA polymerase sigma factor [Dactylosporangium aurantiacum]
MDLTVTVSTHEDAGLVELTGALDFASAPYLRHVVFGLFDDGHHHVTIDVSQLSLLDAGAIRALLYLHTRAEQLGGGLHAAGATGTVLTALEITGVAKTLRAYDELDWPVAERDRRAVRLDGTPVAHGLWPVEATELLNRLHQLAPDDPDRARLRDDIIERCLPAAYRFARRFHSTTDSLNDLLQVAALGLIKAVDGFDATRGVEFGTYATPTVTGELKRHFRDRNAGVRLPRRLQELRLAANRARDDLTQTLGHTPTAPELAAHLDVDTEQILEMIGSTGTSRPLSLDLPVAGTEDETTLGDTVGAEDPQLDLVEDRTTLQALIARLPKREQRILSLRFYGNRSQSEIAQEVGLSQMHVSRLLRHSLDYLHRRLTEQ